MRGNKLVLFVVLMSLLVLAACGGGNNEVDANENNATTNNEATDQGVEVDKGLLNVEMTIPLELLGEDSEAFEESLTEEWDGKIVEKDDTSITVKMSKKEHAKMLKGFRESIEEGFQELIKDDELPSIKDITTNKDFTSIKMVVDREVFENSFDSFSILSLGFSSMLYQVFDGKDLEKEKITIEIEDEATGEIFQEVVYPDALEEMDESLDEWEE